MNVGAVNHKGLRCGRIAYTNDLPVYAAFDLGVIRYPGSLHADVPSRLNAMLLDGTLDLSPVSAFAWAAHANELVLLPDLCIGARDDVVSVVLVSETAPALLGGAEIAVTGESASGRNLLRVLLERHYGVVPKYVQVSDPFARAQAGTPALLIGDSAIDALERFPAKSVYDLGRLWHEWTGEQTVFAVWAARRDAYEHNLDGVRACMHALTDAYTWSRSHMERVIDRAQLQAPRAPGFYASYYGKLNFTYHCAAQRGLAAYCAQLYALGAIASVPSSLPEVIGLASR
ncbi:MAG: menaquinone biosynthesis protein [Candidatus Eremiobacteraeota bacterium]|nr:menaquinone biosynthesis protein [Candidatus Eremiobacteraeota bacterium]